MSKPQAVTATVESVIAAPSAYGLKFVTRNAKKGPKIYKNKPHMVVDNIPLFASFFPDKLAFFINQTSCIVVTKRYARSDDNDVTIVRRNINWLFDVREAGAMLRYVGPNGVKYATPEEADEAIEAELDRRLQEMTDKTA